jgi:beta-glucosidase
MKTKTLAAAALCAAALARSASAALPPLPPADAARVEALISTMTLEDKAGQMTQLTLGYFVMTPTATAGGYKVLDAAKLEDAVVNLRIGSMLNVADDGAYAPERWRALVAQIQADAAKTRLAIPVLYGMDAMHGAGYTAGSVLFPKEISLAATRDEDGVRGAYEATARELRASDLPWNFAPVLDVARQPLWSRFDETFGEDTYLASRLGAAAVRGQQGEDPSAPGRVAACLKHYVGYSFPWSGKDRTPAYVDERTLREVFLPPFEAAVKAGALSVMVNSAEIGGIPGHANKHLLTEVLKGELGFEGLVVSDWRDIRNLHDRDRVAATDEDAVAAAVNAGVDMSMVPDDPAFPALLVQAVRDGKVTQARVDDAVRRILRLKARLGLFAKAPPAQPRDLGGVEAEFLSRRLAAESIVLLKNDGVLPLKAGAKILVTGPAADSKQALNGSWTLTWQGDDEKLYPESWSSVLGAVRRKDAAAVYAPGSGFSEAGDVKAAVAAASGADAAVVVLGEKAYAETPGNIDDLTLDAPQRDLALSLEKAGVPVILVLAEGRPRVLGEAAEGARAIVFAGRPGPYGGDAVADVLFGGSNPSGRLPFSYPRFTGALTPYDRKPSEDAGGNKYDPLFPFGAGLGYAPLRVADLKVERSAYVPGESVVITANVVNDGTRDAEDAVDLFVSQRYASITPSVRRLKGFRRVKVAAGKTEPVTFTLDGSDLSFVGADLKRVIEAGEFDVYAGTLTASFRLVPAP